MLKVVCTEVAVSAAWMVGGKDEHRKTIFEFRLPKIGRFLVLGRARSMGHGPDVTDIALGLLQGRGRARDLF